MVIALTARTDAMFYSTVIAYDLEWHATMEEMRAALSVEPFQGPDTEAAAV